VVNTAPAPPSRRPTDPDVALRAALPAGWPRAARLAALILGGVFAITLFAVIAERLWYRGRVLPTVRVASVVVGGQSQAQARATIMKAAATVEQAPITSTVDGQTLTMDPASIDTRVDIDATLRAARRAGRSTNPLNAVVGMLLRQTRPDTVALAVTYDKQKLNGAASGWADQASSGRANAEVRIVGTTVTVIPPKTGTGISVKEAEAKLAIAVPSTTARAITLKTGKAEPDISLAAANATAAKVQSILSQPLTMTVSGTPLTLAPDKLAPALSVGAKNQSLIIFVDSDVLRTAFGPALAAFERAPAEAGFTINGPSVAITPSQDGVQVDLNSVGSSIAVGQHAITANPRPVKAVHSTEWAQRMNITEMVSTFTTQHPPGQERVKNIHRAADVVNNTVVEPGGTFSLNDTLGKRTAASGYVSAPVYVQGEFQDDFGGGVSQFTTTLYNATFFGGYRDIAHAPHSIYIARYPMGREATLNFGSIDLKFQNDSNNGILIRTSYSASSITVSLYSTKDGRTVKAEGPNILEQVEAETEYTEDPALPPGTEKETQAGHPRIVVENFRILTRPGQPDKRERYTWTYEMMKRKVARNSKAPAPTPAPPAAGTPSTTKPK